MMSAMPRDESERRTGSRAIDRAVELLVVYEGVNVDASLGELSSKLELPLSTVHRIVQALVRGGLLVQDPITERYHLGSTLISLGQRAAQRVGMSEATRILEELAAASGESVALAVHRRGRAQLVCQAESPHPLRVHVAMGATLSMHATATGKLFLAQSDDPEADIRALGTLERFTEFTFTDPEQLLREVTAIRDTGHSVNTEETTIGVRSVAVPVLDVTSTTVAALFLEGPIQRLPEERVAELIPQMHDAAKRVGAATSFSLM
jgi:IclR family acetate operon transcriptional repressor